MKKCVATIFLLSFLSASAHAADERDAELQSFVLGNYLLIGKAIGNKNTYYGQVAITQSEAGLKVTRTIAGKTIRGVAAVERATPDKIPVLRIRFTEDDHAHEATCMVSSDLDNYARMTCFLYMPGINSMEPGMEALFINYNKPK